MKRKFTFLIAAMALIIAIMSPQKAWGQERGTWNRVTSVADVTSGGIFILGYEATANSGIIVPMQNEGTATTSSAGIMYSGTENGSSGSGTINMATISETAKYEVTITPSTKVAGAVNIMIGGNYLGNTDTKNNCKLFTSEATTTAFTPTIGTNNVVTLKINANNTYHTLQYNSSNPRYAVYGGTQKNIVMYKKNTAVATPTFSPKAGVYQTAQNVTISCSTTDAKIYYTTDGSTPTTTSSVYSSAIAITETTTIKAMATKTGMTNSEVATAVYTISSKISPTNTWSQTAYTATIGGTNSFPTFTSNAVTEEGATISYESSNTDAATINATTGEISLVAAGTTTITANTTETTSYLPGSASYTLTVKNAPLSTMDAIFAKATAVGSTATNVEVTFNNWIISGVSGNNAYLTDGTKGLIIYSSGHGFKVGDILSGTTSCKVQLYYGSSELTSLTTETTGLTVSSGGVLTPVTMTIDQITNGVYSGAVIKINNVLYNGTNLSDGDNNIKPYNKLYSDMSFTSDKYYNVTGVYLQFNSTKEIMPRSAADIEELAATEYAINLNQVTGGTISADKATAATGVEVTLSYELSQGYAFGGWTVLDGSAEEVTVTDNKFTMPASNVEVEATFNEVVTHTVTYCSNGVTNQVSASLISELPTPINIPTDFNFAGWTLSESEIEFVTAPIEVTEDMTLYAVFSREEGGTGYFEKIKTNLTDWTGKYLLVYESSNVTWTGVDEGQCHTEVIIDNDVISSKPDDAVVLDIAPMTGGYSIKIVGGTNNGKYIGKSADANGMDIDNNPLLNTFGYDNEIVVVTAAGGCTLRYNASSGTSNERFRYYKNGQQAIQLYKKNSGTTHYYTRVFNETATADITISGTSIIPAGSTLNMGEFELTNETAANLIIEDGAELILADDNTDVNATVEKNIAAASSWTSSSSDGWYTISGPITEFGKMEFITGLATTTGDNDYDLYQYNEENASWYNYKGDNGDFDFENGVGYLYANKKGTTIKFEGELFAEETIISVSASSTSASLKGFNLIGNPYTHTISMENISPAMSGGYVLTNTGGWNPSLNTEIKPCEGMMVQVPDETDMLTISNNVTSKERSNREHISVNVRNSHYEDNAFAVFGDGSNLTKLSHRNTEIPMVYVKQNGSNYAIATLDDDAKAFDLGFRAATTSKYTINIKTEGNFNYIHLIDRMTGEDIDMLLEGSYSFVGSPRDNDSRFIVRLGADENNDVNENFVYQSGNNLFVNGTGTLQIIDILGRIVVSKEINGVNVSVDNLTKGAYIVRMISTDIKSQKLVIK